MNRLLKFYQMASSILLLMGLILSMAIFVLTDDRTVTVVLQEGKERSYYIGRREGVVTKNDVKEFIKTFIQNRYTWEEFNPEKIIDRIRCLTTLAQQKELIKSLGKNNYQNQDGKKIEQYVAFIVPRVENTGSFVSFDRILRINGSPLAVPLNFSLGIIQGQRTHCNPMGLYVSKILETDQ